jgi:hypothetical protein
LHATIALLGPFSSSVRKPILPTGIETELSRHAISIEVSAENCECTSAIAFRIAAHRLEVVLIRYAVAVGRVDPDGQPSVSTACLLGITIAREVTVGFSYRVSGETGTAIAFA